MRFLRYVFFKDKFIIIRHYFSYIFSYFHYIFTSQLVILNGDIELNPGPKPSSFKYFSICYWNLNSITSHDFLKVKLLTEYDVMHKFDFTCISESYLNPWLFILVIICPVLSILLEMEWGVSIYYKVSLLLKCLTITFRNAFVLI